MEFEIMEWRIFPAFPICKVFISSISFEEKQQF